ARALVVRQRQELIPVLRSFTALKMRARSSGGASKRSAFAIAERNASSSLSARVQSGQARECSSTVARVWGTSSPSCKASSSSRASSHFIVVISAFSVDQQGLERRTGARQAGHHRANWDANYASNLLVAQLFELSEHQDLAKARWQPLKCAVHLAPLSFRDCCRFWVGQGAARGILDHCLLDLSQHVVDKNDLCRLSAALEARQADVAHNRQQPGLLAVTLIAIEMLPGAQITVLHGVLSLLRMAHHPTCEAVGRIEVRQHQLLELGVGATLVQSRHLSLSDETLVKLILFRLSLSETRSADK